ncbi:hypothetical protein Pmar_PMAR024051 [Perkinsus marinus ATCC 50983]|uniref:SAP domain-containing protein n=1 Tax=Perkinsus marinus (strain ATCC 50983 / TXsc) TaxID=423536 RepID=C5L6I6_PERM5|nr:hypothetical protein Pmar_PMAR024051 [Perkinsus marinus ATCC 50983]EER07647.1 hypothetical protein Pmar_PMAR024051 [Perkinsus marinus ATCC 50983]|eukprot:XP_002775831.1 hypothetical protein Pmar_PMAR024051 [Perkinsus marinus ATCC 50983]
MADLHQQFGAMRVGQLRTLCKQKGIASDGGKRDLVQRLCELADQSGAPTDTSDCQSVPGDVILEPSLSHEELHELATIADEIRHIRKQTEYNLLRHQQHRSAGVAGYRGSFRHNVSVVRRGTPTMYNASYMNL